MKQSIYILLTAILFSGNLFAQTPEERQEIIRNYDLEKLDQLQEELHNNYSAKKREAVAYALRNDIDIVIDKEDGGVAVLQEVLEDGTLIYYETTNAGSAETSNTNELYNGGSLGLDLDGTNMTVGVWDGGLVRESHQELTGRVTQGDDPGGLSDTHATHVTGTVAAAGVNPNARGMAYNADVIAYDFGGDFSEMATEATNGLLLSNHSYGIGPSQIPDSAFGAYIGQAADLDEILYNAPFYCVQFSAGNSRNQGFNPNDGGFDLLTGTSLAKNAIVVANVNEVSNYTGPNSVSMSQSSSWGPTDDGRIKPDISAKGVNVFSPIATSDSNYGFLSGTSMSAPSVTGSLALIQELNNEMNGNFLRAASLRAIMINSAREAGNSPGPDFRFGWGLMDSEEMANTIMNNGFTYLIEENTLQNNGSYSNTVQAVGANTPLKVTIAWQDLEGPPQSIGDEDNSTPRLVNDLDLRVTDANNNVTRPWTLNNIVPSLPANKSDNNVDNVEQVVVDNAVGDFTISVDHKGTLQDAPQNYTIVVSGIAESSFTFTPDALVKDVCSNEDAVFNLQFSSIDSYNGPTNFSASGLPGSLTTDFSPNNFNSDGDVTLTISNLGSVAAGEYDFDVTASGQGESFTRSLTVEILDSNTVGSVSLNSPTGGQTDISIAPTLSWQALPNVNDYTVQVSNNSNFNNVIFSQITDGTSVNVPELDEDTQYFWRVSAANDCSSGNFTSAGFTTEQINCLGDSVSNDTPVTIPVNGPDTQTVTLDYTSTNNELVHDISVSLDITHTYIEDLTISLESPNGTSVLLVDGECGDGDDMNVTFDDTGVALSCNTTAPAISGTLRPVEPLSNFVGEDPNGTWVLTVVDSFTAEDGGSVDDFSIEICDGTATFSTNDVVNEQEAFKIYPNPANEQITLAFTANSVQKSDISIFDISGKLVKSFKIDQEPSTTINLNVADLSTGVYFVKTQSESGTQVEKLIIE